MPDQLPHVHLGRGARGQARAAQTLADFDGPAGPVFDFGAFRLRVHGLELGLGPSLRADRGGLEPGRGLPERTVHDVLALAQAQAQVHAGFLVLPSGHGQRGALHVVGERRGGLDACGLRFLLLVPQHGLAPGDVVERERAQVVVGLHVPEGLKSLVHPFEVGVQGLVGGDAQGLPGDPHPRPDLLLVHHEVVVHVGEVEGVGGVER